MVDRCRPEFSLGPSVSLGVEGGAVPLRLVCASHSALSSGFSLGVNVFFPFLICHSRSIARSITVTGVGMNC